MSPNELREHVKKLFGNKIERLELDLSHPTNSVLVWKIKYLKNDVINRNIANVKDRFGGCEMDQTEISSSIVDVLKTASGIYGTVALIIGVLLTILRFL